MSYCQACGMRSNENVCPGCGFPMDSDGGSSSIRGSVAAPSMSTAPTILDDPLLVTAAVPEITVTLDPEHAEAARTDRAPRIVTAPPRPPVRRPGGFRRLLTAVVLLAVVLGGAWWATHRDSGPKELTVEQRTTNQARAVDALLTKSAQGRAVVAKTVSALAGCDGSIDPDKAVADLQTVVTNRTQLLAQEKALAVDLLPSGAELRTQLTAAWTKSLEADKAYLAWAKGIAGGGKCSAKAATKVKGDKASKAATAAKTKFVKLWNTKVAGPEKLPIRKESQI